MDTQCQTRNAVTLDHALVGVIRAAVPAKVGSLPLAHTHVKEGASCVGDFFVIIGCQAGKKGTTRQKRHPALSGTTPILDEL